MKKLVSVSVTLCIMLLTTVAGHAADFYFFDGGGGDSLWTTPDNWDLSGFSEPPGYPGQSFPNDVVIVRTEGNKRAQITDGMNIALDFLTQWSTPGSQSLDDGFDMTGGRIDLVGGSAKLEMGSNTPNIPITVDVSGGTITGRNFTLGGVATCPASEAICQEVDSDGTWNLSGNAIADFAQGGGSIGSENPRYLLSTGTLNMSDNAMLTVDNLTFSSAGNALLTLADDAKLILLGNDEQQMTDEISSGWITSLAAGMVPVAMYDEGLDQTTVMLDVGGDDPLAGDYDDSGEVEVGDLNLVLFNWDQPGPGLPAEWVNQRPAGNVAVDELNGVLFNWGNTAAVATVPEPTTGVLAFVVIALIGSTIRRNRR